VQVGYEKYGHQADVEVIREWQERDNAHFPIEELNWTREGLHSKPQRVKRLEPDFRAGRFRLPAAVWNPNVPGGKGGLAYWSIAEASDPAHRAGQIIYRPYKGAPDPGREVRPGLPHRAANQGDRRGPQRL
jgi:hypothetical protein